RASMWSRVSFTKSLRPKEVPEPEGSGGSLGVFSPGRQAAESKLSRYEKPSSPGQRNTGKTPLLVSRREGTSRTPCCRARRLRRCAIDVDDGAGDASAHRRADAAARPAARRHPPREDRRRAR